MNFLKKEMNIKRNNVYYISVNNTYTNFIHFNQIND